MSRQAIAYCRVSTDEQAEHGYSIQTQLDACRSWASLNGYQVMYEITDDYTGTAIDRPGFSRVLELIQAGKADALIVYSADRLSRNLVHRVIIRDELQRANAQLIYCSRGVIGNSPTDRFLDNMEGAVAEYEVGLIKERMMRGKRAKAERGIPIGHGNVPFGYRIVGSRQQTQFEIVEEEAQVVRLIFALFSQGKIQTEIAEYLTQMGIPSRADVRDVFGKKRGYGTWSRMMVYQILTNETYTGTWYAFRYKRDGKKVTKRPKESWIPASVPPIISYEEWEIVQKKLKIRSGRKRTNHFEYLLSGHIKCACGYSVNGKPKHSGRKTYLYYVCSAKGRFRALHWCDLPCFKTEVVDKAVWEWIENLLRDPENIAEGLRGVHAEVESSNQKLLERIGFLEQQIESISQQEDRLLSLYLDDRIPKSVLDDKMVEFENMKEKMSEEAANTKSLLVYIPTKDEIIGLSEVVRKIGDRLLGATYKEKRQIIDLLDVTVTLSHQEKERYVNMECLIGESIVSLMSLTSSD